MMQRILGLDCGIASVGWAVLEYDAAETTGSIIACGTRMFDTPETDKERRPKSELRRMYRGQRRVIRRRRQRMNAVRKLLLEHGLLPDAKSDALKYQGIDPWAVRAKANDTLLSKEELAIALGHIARHRGFKSNAKSQGENDVESSKMKKAMAQTQEKFAGRTFGETLASDPEFKGRKRNKEGDFSRTPLRKDLVSEVGKIFAAQRRLGSTKATVALEAAFQDENREWAPFYQKELEDSEIKVVHCAFETAEKRTAKRAYSFELFRFLQRLNNLKVQGRTGDARLSIEELADATRNFGKTKKITFKALKRLIKLPDETRFEHLKEEDEKNDVTSRHGASAEGTGTLYALLAGAAWESLVKTPEKLDRIAEVISFRMGLDKIRTGLQEIGLEEVVLEKLMHELQFSTFNLFIGTGHISAKACRNMLPHLAQRLDYYQAATKCNYDHTASRERNAFDVGVTGKEALKKILSTAKIDRSMVGSPIARKALIEAVKQVKAVVEVHGIPDAIHIELARDVGKGIDERKEIERGIEKRNKEKEKLLAELAEIINKPKPSADDLLRYELWKQQNGRCVYSDAPLDPRKLVAGSNDYEVDHILPWSRFGDDSFHNKSLCTAKANREKQGRTPAEWFSDDKSDAEWEAYVARVLSLPSLRGFKRRNYTIKDAKEIQDKFRTRNLNDTRWTCRLLAECLKQLYPIDERHKVKARPGALTDRMRRGWGFQKLKKDEKSGERIPNDQHHALDAIITAATTDRMVIKLTEAFKQQEVLGNPRDFSDLPEPWMGFRRQTETQVDNVFVSRAERHRARGEAHAATIRSVVEVDGEQRVFERKRVSDLKLTDLEKIKNPDRNAAVIESLRNWIEVGKPEATPPLSPKGDPISKVTLLTNKKPDVIVREGAVDRGEMARVDVFRKKSAAGAWQHFVIPIYPHHIARDDTPPNRAVQANTPEEKWPSIDETYEFMWSLTPMTYLEIETGKGELMQGYFRGMDRATGAVIISDHKNSGAITKGIGARTLKTFSKYTIDRLGQKFLVESELRTWRGKVCISPTPQG